MVPHRFGRSSPFSVGLEEELFVVDGETLAPAPVPPGLLDGARFKAELFTSMLELTTSVCAEVGEAVAELAELRSVARRHVQEAGLELVAVGTWPTAVSEREEVTPKEPLLRFAEYAGSSARRQHCAGLHVHVGVASPEECMGRLEAVLPWLSVLLALSANSPYTAGAETGLASTRAELLALLPRSGAPPAFDGYEAWSRFAESLVRLGLADDLMRLWWDVRPHPRLGTLEIRVPDQPTRLADTAAFAALAHALVAAADPGRAGRRPRSLRPEPLGGRQVRRGRRADPPRGGSAREPGGAARRASRAGGADGEEPGLGGSARPPRRARPGRRTARARSSRRAPFPLRDPCCAHIRWSVMAVRSETIQVSGIRCERCVMRLGHALEKLDGLESAHANLVGDVMLAWDDERVGRDEIVAALSRAGFRPATVAAYPE